MNWFHRYVEAPLVGAVLAVANRRPPFFGRETFFALKEQICGEYGELRGSVWQHIRKECWTCNGTGVFSDYGYPERCRKCWGSGVYSEKWHRLEVWTVGRRVFHRPAESRIVAPAGVEIAIEGVMEKSGDERDALEAYLWLLVAFGEPGFFLRMLLASRSGRPGPRPMLWLQWLATSVVWPLRSLAIRECITCGVPFVRPFANSLHFQCRRCERDRHAAWLAQREWMTEEECAEMGVPF